MRGKRRKHQRQLRQAGWMIDREYKSPSGRHCLVLRHLHGVRNPSSEHDARGEVVEIEAPTRPRSYRRAAHLCLIKRGRRVRARHS
jgi:hypothetical protein